VALHSELVRVRRLHGSLSSFANRGFTRAGHFLAGPFRGTADLPWRGLTHAVCSSVQVNKRRCPQSQVRRPGSLGDLHVPTPVCPRILARRTTSAHITPHVVCVALTTAPSLVHLRVGAVHIFGCVCWFVFVCGSSNYCV
jgi:hypothetical protein